jgi:hypothetical protein
MHTFDNSSVVSTHMHSSSRDTVQCTLGNVT